MLHPSYSDLLNVVNSEVEQGETPVVNSRYSIVLATAKRARQIIARQSGDNLDVIQVSKPLSKAVSELYEGKIKVLPEEEATEEEATEEVTEEAVEDMNAEAMEESAEAVAEE